MKSRATPRFWTACRELRADVNTAAQQAYRLFRDNPQHPSLHFKKVHKREPVYSVRVTLAYRALGFVEQDEVTRFWIGSHDEYDRLLKAL